jgi:type I restriction enzyme, S subunit
MKTTRLDLPVMASWMESNQRRLDGKPYLSGAFEAKVILERLLKENLQHLWEVTQGGLKGIFNGPRFARSYVDDPDYGVPFLGSTDILAADFSNLAMISKKQVKAHPELLIDEGWTLITCSGTIGRMAYSRADMKGMTGSQHFMRVVPDCIKLPPGYLYAYLSSKFGVPLIVSGTYGAIIQHIEPHHISKILVPRLGDEIEAEANRSIEKAARNRVQASQLLKEASEDILNYFDLEFPNPLHKYTRPSTTVASSTAMYQRLDGYYYAQWNNDAYSSFDSVASSQKALLGDVTADVYIPGIFKRAYTEDPAFGYPYITGADVYYMAPTSDRYILKQIAENYRLVLHDGMILVQDSGQLGGLIGRPANVGRYLDGFACTNNMVRIVPQSKDDQGYIFAVLNTDYGVRLLMREATGSSIPHLDEKRVRRIQIPWADAETRKRLGQKVVEAINLRDDACDLETKARILVETAIEKGAALNL